MLPSHGNRRAARLVAASVLLSVAVNAQQSQLTVGPNVLVSTGHPRDWHSEVQLASDPADARRLFACSYMWNASQGEMHTVDYLSVDGGTEWRPVFESDTGRHSGDPACAFGSNHALLIAALSWPSQGDGPRTLTTVHSRDDGHTWASVQLPFVDREYFVVDYTQSKFRGRTYLYGDGELRPYDNPVPYVGSIKLYRSDDDGTTYLPSISLPASGTHVPMGIGNGEVLSDGTLVIPVGELNSWSDVGPNWSRQDVSLKIKAVTSSDGGETFNPAVVATEWQWCRHHVGTITPYLAADHGDGPFRDRLYLVWADGRSGQCHIMLSTSADEGKSWSTPIQVDDQPRHGANPADQSMPTVAVNKNGVVGIGWYDRREDPASTAWKVRFAASFDGGRSVTPSVAVSDAAYAVSWNNGMPLFSWTQSGESASPKGPGSMMLTIGDGAEMFAGGDTGGIAADADGVFHMLWPDNRTGIAQLWTATITANGHAEPQGDARLRHLADVTDKVWIDMTNTHYDPTTHSVSVDLVVRNISKNVLHEPLLVQAWSIESAFGTPTVRSMPGSPTVWDLSPRMRNGALSPDELTLPQRLTISLSDLRPLQPPLTVRDVNDLIQIRLSVYCGHADGGTVGAALR